MNAPTFVPAPTALALHLDRMVAERPTSKATRHRAVELLVGLVAEAEPAAVVEAWQVTRKRHPGGPPRFPREALCQGFAVALVRSGVPEAAAFDLAAWLEEKFSAGKHACWSLFLDRTLLRPLGVPAELLTEVVLPLEGMLHVFDDYIDTQAASPTTDLMDLGLGSLLLAVLPRLVAARAGDAATARAACHALAEAIEEVLDVPRIEDDTPHAMAAAPGDLGPATRNIDGRTRATTGVFLRPLMALLPEQAPVLQAAWTSLWLVRATEMCMKDAVFDVEADLLNQDHTPASVWATWHGAGSPAWCGQIAQLFAHYLRLWNEQAETRASLPAGLVRAAESHLHRNRFLVESIETSAQSGLPAGLRGVRRIFMVAAGKGGVGKSTVSWLLTHALRQRGHRVGVIDADIWGPSQNLLFRRSSAVAFEGDAVVPTEVDGITVVSLGQFVNTQDAILLRSTLAASLLARFAHAVRWPAIDYLVIDLPPGASDVHIQLCQLFPEAEIVLVTLEQPLAVADTARALSIYAALNKKVAGLVMNMTAVTCECCNHTTALGSCVEGWDDLALSRLPLLAKLPYDPRLAGRSGGAPDGGALGGLVDRLCA